MTTRQGRQDNGARTMKAWVLERQAPIEDRPLQLVDVPVPIPGPEKIRLKVEACGVCRTDVHIAEGDLALKKSPLVLGHEIVGRVDALGEGVTQFQVGDWAGVYWLHSACGQCRYCRAGLENYCPDIVCTGWDVDGGFAEYVTACAAYAVPLNHVLLSPVQIAPLMCPGIAGYAAFKLAGLQAGDRLGLYGFGPTAHFAVKLARARDVETFVSTRSPRNIRAALQAGANWANDSAREPFPCSLHASILFPPAGNLVEPALAQLEPGGTLVLAPVSASPIHVEDYSRHLWGRTIKTLYNLNRADAREFFDVVNQLSLSVGTSLFDFERLPEALIQVRHGALDQPNAVIVF